MRVQSVASFVLAGSVLAPVSAAAAPAFDWTGFYVGVNGTGDRQDVSTSGTADVAQVSGIFWPGRGVIIVPGTVVSFPGDQFHSVTGSAHRKIGGGFGGQAGYDWQFGRFVAGVGATCRRRTGHRPRPSPRCFPSPR
jgi:hypothetical protein